MKKYIYMVAALLMGACYNEEVNIIPSDDNTTSVTLPEDATQGEVIIKFKPEMEALLDATMTRSGGVATRSGIPSTDEVLEILDAYHFERVFPVDQRHEMRTRENGLHLWYIVRFDENEDLNKAFVRLSKLGEVDKIQCNRELKRAYVPDSEPVFISCAEADSRVATRSMAMPFDDPDLYRQWCYHNDGTTRDFVSERAGIKAGADAGCLEAWELCTGDEEIIVAVMDEAVMWSHPDLADNIWVNEGEELYAGKDADGNVTETVTKEPVPTPTRKSCISTLFGIMWVIFTVLSSGLCSTVRC
mgnify:CR=1 FL=1